MKEKQAVGHSGRIAFEYVLPEQYFAIDPAQDSGVIAAVVHGTLELPTRPWPQARSGLHPLAGPSVVEVIRAAGPLAYGQDGVFSLAWTPDYLFASCSARESPDESLRDLAENLYLQLIDLCRRQGYPDLLRIWNIVPSINADQEGMERYKHFCLGRHEGLIAKIPDLTTAFPAACGVGCHGEELNLYFLAARSPGEPIENPKQISAYAYPPRYGPKSPSFSRALIKSWGQEAGLFLSGTASIIGHESQNPGDLAGQIAGTLDNLETLTAVASERSGLDFSLTSPSSLLKAYVRSSGDYQETREIVEGHLGTDVPVLYLLTDLCRSELLVELDGIVYGGPK